MPVSSSEAKSGTKSPSGLKSSSEAKSKLIQEGSYGCAFTPPLHCKKSRASSTERQVGKIIKKKDAKVELSISHLIQAIPGWERYYLIQEEDSCTSKNFEALRMEYENQCKTLRKAKDSSLLQLLSPHGGTTLFDLTLTNSFDYIGSFRHMLEGIVKLQSQGICHFDIHEANILVDRRGTLRLIDFGAAFVGQDVDSTNLWRHIYDFQPEYAPQPPELSVQNGLNQGLSISYSIQQTIAQKKVFKQLERLFGIPAYSHTIALDRFWQGWKGENWISFFHTYWKTWDTWAIGVIFLRLLEKSFLLPSFVNTQWPIYGRHLKLVLKGLLNVNPVERMSAEVALKLLSL